MSFVLRPFLPGLALLPLLALPQAQAASLNDVARNTQVSGFLSIRGGQVLDDGIAYLNTLKDTWSFSEESVLGLQADSQVNDRLAVSLQMKNDTGNGRVEMEWGYLEYAFASDMKVRVGRLRAPGFMLSEFLDVGYAYPWVNVPEEVYGWLPFSRYEGVDLRYWQSIGGADIRLTPFAGTTSGQKLNLGNAEYTDQSSQFGGLDLQVSYDIYTFRAGYSRYRFDLSNSSWDRFVNEGIEGTVLSPYAGPAYPEIRKPGFLDFVRDVLGGEAHVAAQQNEAVPGIEYDDVLSIAQSVFGADAAQVATERTSLMAQLDPYQAVPGMNGRYGGRFMGVGVGVDDGSYLLMSELSRSSIGGVYPDVDSGYLMVGKRFGRWMPHLTLARMSTTDDGERPDLGRLQFNPAIWGLSPVLQQAVDGTNVYTDVLAGITQLVSLEQQRYTLGVRWDAMDGLALKAEVFRVDLHSGSYGFALPEAVTDLARSGGTSSVTSVSIPEAPDRINGVKMSVDLVF